MTVGAWLRLIACYCFLLTVALAPVGATIEQSANARSFVRDESSLPVEWGSWGHVKLSTELDSHSSSSERPAPLGTAGIALQVGMSPTWEVMEGVDVVWQIPPTPRAVLLISHGAGSTPTEYFDWHPNCRVCIGLPEHRAIVLEALARGYAVIGIKSVGYAYTFELESNVDVSNVMSILASWRQRHGLGYLPLSAVGSSAGGVFNSILALRLKMYSMAVMIANVDADVLQILSAGDYPPLMFVHMPRDAATERSVTYDMESLHSKGVPCSDTKCYPKSVTPGFFSERIPGLTLELSQDIFYALQQNGYLDLKGFLNSTPHDVMKLVEDLDVLPIDNVFWLKAVEQEVKVAYAFHCVTSEKKGEMFDWLDGKSWSTYL